MTYSSDSRHLVASDTEGTEGKASSDVTHGTSFCVLSITTNSLASVRERTVQTERPPLVGEVSANFCR
jgi:hypothetical protein